MGGVSASPSSPNPWIMQPVHVNNKAYDPKNPPSINLGEYVSIYIGGWNYQGGTATEGDLQISFPDLTSDYSSVKVVSDGTTLPNSKAYPPRTTVWCEYGSYQKKSTYWFVEGYAAPWETDKKYFLKARVKPEKAGSFKFQVKMVTASDGYKNWHADPQTNGTPKAPIEYFDSVGKDQQKEYVYVYHRGVQNKNKPDID